MQRFFLRYPNEVVETGDFFEIKRTMDSKGVPLSFRYELGSITVAVSFKTGRFYIDDICICPADGDIILTDKKVEYRPIWFRRWYRTFQVNKGEIDARWILFLGWQFTENGRNHKRTMQIHQDGRVGVG